MSNYYKLTPEIKDFIIKQKVEDYRQSCRSLVSCVEQNFSIKLSKSLVNNVIKESNLSSPVGRRAITPLLKEEKPENGMENGGLFFLKAADIKLSLTLHLAQNLSFYFRDLSMQTLQETLEAAIFAPFYPNFDDLCLIIGKPVSQDKISQFQGQLSEIPLPELNNLMKKVDFLNYILKKMDFLSCNINNINELYQECLLRLNSYAQSNLFPLSCRAWDFSAMKERFYSLRARISKENGIFEIQCFPPKGFFWGKDLTWKEAFNYAADKINQGRVFTKDRYQIKFGFSV